MLSEFISTYLLLIILGLSCLFFNFSSQIGNMFSSFYDFIKNLFPLCYEKKDTAELFDINKDIKAEMDNLLIKAINNIKLNVGQKCSINKDCKNNACGRNGGVNSPTICCPGNKVFNSPSGYDYCENVLELNRECGSDKQCKSGNCDGNTFDNGHCREFSEKGSRCSRNNNCKSKKCSNFICT